METGFGPRKSGLAFLLPEHTIQTETSLVSDSINKKFRDETHIPHKLSIYKALSLLSPFYGTTKYKKIINRKAKVGIPDFVDFQEK